MLPEIVLHRINVFVRIISAKRRFAQLEGDTELVKDIDPLFRDDPGAT